MPLIPCPACRRHFPPDRPTDSAHRCPYCRNAFTTRDEPSPPPRVRRTAREDDRERRDWTDQNPPEKLPDSIHATVWPASLALRFVVGLGVLYCPTYVFCLTYLRPENAPGGPEGVASALKAFSCVTVVWLLRLASLVVVYFTGHHLARLDRPTLILLGLCGTLFSALLHVPEVAVGLINFFFATPEMQNPTIQVIGFAGLLLVVAMVAVAIYAFVVFYSRSVQDYLYEQRWGRLPSRD